MDFRIATLTDIPALSHLRLSVRENILSDPTRVTAEDYRDMLGAKGRGWVCEIDGVVIGFSIVDLTRANVWALFILPKFEGRGIGKNLMELLTEWTATQGIGHLWLTTDPGTRAEGFYEKMGWAKKGMTEDGEVRFELEL